MRHSTTLLSLLLAICTIPSVFADSKPAAAKPAAAKPAAPRTIASPLVLNDGAVLFVQPSKNADARPGSPAVYRAEAKCAVDGRVIGDCAWTGTYLTNEGEGLVNYLVTCVMNLPCGAYKAGSIDMVGRAKGVESESYVELAIVGGTGPYASATGVYSWRAGVGTFRLQRK